MERCETCGSKVLMMVQKGTGFCSQLCAQKREQPDNEEKEGRTT